MISLKKLKKIANPCDVHIACHSPFSSDVVSERDKEYPVLSDIAFEKKYRHYVYTPATLEFNGVKHEIQFNFCNNTFCKWYGMPQRKYDGIANKPSRYKLVSARAKSEESVLKCNYIAQDNSPGNVLGNHSPTISNWSVAEEIKRLLIINTAVPIEPEYQFHNIDCINAGTTPFNDKNYFYYKGKSTSNSLKYQCKVCKKNTNVLPEQDKSFGYHQQRNDILNEFCKLIMSRTPVKRICEILKISPTTFYAKLEWVYRKCLEFNERHETKVLKNMHFHQININTDMMVYNLNNIRLKGRGKGKKIASEEKKPMTYIVSSADSNSGYVFRSDVAYDYQVTLDDVENDTKKYHCDHSYTYLRKNDRLKFSYCPPPLLRMTVKANLNFRQN
jgi:transposase-like protein